jgi:RNA polymerase sigma factor (sigma-70 family)
MSKVLDHLRKAALAGGEAERTDGHLLECFVTANDAAALEALVRRHGPMVWGVCRRVLRNHQDAEDAFQATFLVLVRKAACVKPREMVVNWLYGVAHRTALKARATAAKRAARERRLMDLPEPEAAPAKDVWSDLRPFLDQELSRLPDKYRSTILLCDLEGKSRKEAACRLKIPEGTLSSRLTTARAKLARRLARHGLAVSGGALAVVLSEKAASGAVPPVVLSCTIRTATLVAAGTGAAVGVIPAQVAALIQGVLTSMLLNKLKTLALVSLLVCLLGGGLGASLLARQTETSEAPQPPAQRGDQGAQGQAGKAAPANAAEAKAANLERRLTEMERRILSQSHRILMLTEEIAALRKELKPPTDQPADQRDIKFFSMHNMPASEVAKTLEQLLAYEKRLRIATLPSTNSIIVQGDRADLRAVEELIARLEDHWQRVTRERRELERSKK